MSRANHDFAVEVKRRLSAQLDSFIAHEARFSREGDDKAAEAFGDLAHDLETLIGRFGLAIEAIPRGDYDPGEQDRQDAADYRVRAA